MFLLSSGAISWSSKKQPIVSLSSIEAEFIAAASCACQAVWLKRVLGKLGQNQGKPTIIHCDSSSAIKLSKNPVMHGRSKHIDVCFHFLRELTKAGTVELVHCGTQEQLADVMTKPLKLDAFLKVRGLLGVCSEMDINWVLIAAFSLREELLSFSRYWVVLVIGYHSVNKSLLLRDGCLF